MRTVSWIIALLALTATPSPGTEPAGGFRSWPQVGHAEQFRLKSTTDQRVGFRLDKDSYGRRVAVAIGAFAESKSASGYNQDALAVDVNGEIMGPRLGGQAPPAESACEDPLRAEWQAVDGRIEKGSAGPHRVVGLGPLDRRLGALDRRLAGVARLQARRPDRPRLDHH